MIANPSTRKSRERRRQAVIYSISSVTYREPDECDLWFIRDIDDPAVGFGLFSSYNTTLKGEDRSILYIGGTVDLLTRRSVHRDNLQKGRHSSKILQAIYDDRDFGDLTFRIIETVEDERDIEERERYHIYRVRPPGNNCEPGKSFTLLPWVKADREEEAERIREMEELEGIGGWLSVAEAYAMRAMTGLLAYNAPYHERCEIDAQRDIDLRHKENTLGAICDSSNTRRLPTI